MNILSQSLMHFI